MPKVLISDSMSPRAEEIFRERGVDVDVITGMTPAELESCIGGYDGLAVRSATKATAEILEFADTLKVIGRAGIGVDNIDIPRQGPSLLSSWLYGVFVCILGRSSSSEFLRTIKETPSPPAPAREQSL